MTNEVALKDLESIHYNHFGISTNDEEAWELAFKALKKQVPMKPKLILNDLGIFGKCVGYVSSCCGLALRIRHDGDTKPIDFYCPECGQAIDWSDDDEM